MTQTFLEINWVLSMDNQFSLINNNDKTKEVVLGEEESVTQRL